MTVRLIDGQGETFHELTVTTPAPKPGVLKKLAAGFFALEPKADVVEVQPGPMRWYRPMETGVSA